MAMVKLNRRVTGLYQPVPNQPYDLVTITHVDGEAGLAKVHVHDTKTGRVDENVLVVDWGKVHEVA